MIDNRKSGHPTQPGNRSTAPSPVQRNWKRELILYRIVRNFKRMHWLERTLLVLEILGICVLMWCVLSKIYSTTPAEKADVQPEQTQTETQEEAPQEYIFRDGDGYPVDMQAITNTWAALSGLEKRYELTDAERWEVASVVTAEAVGEPFAGKMAVAQCILQACEDDGIRPAEALVKYRYAKSRPEPTEEALEAVQAVFDLGNVATKAHIKFFYAPARCSSTFHESQDFALEINGHRFFSEADD